MNSASRLLALFTHCNANSGLQICSLIDSYVSQPGVDHIEARLQATQAILREIRAVQQGLLRLNLDEELFARPAQQLRTYFEPIRQTATWAELKAPNDHDTRKSLMWAAFALKSQTEPVLEESALVALNQSILAQTQLLQEVDLPDSLRDILERQISELNTALAIYRITGVQAVVKVVNQQKGELLHTTEEVVEELRTASPEAKNVFQMGYQLIEMAAKVADAGSKVTKFGREAIEMSATVMKWLG